MIRERCRLIIPAAVNYLQIFAPVQKLITDSLTLLKTKFSRHDSSQRSHMSPPGDEIPIFQKHPETKTALMRRI